MPLDSARMFDDQLAFTCSKLTKGTPEKCVKSG